MKSIKDYCETCGKLSCFKADDVEPLICKKCERSYDEDGTYHESQRKIILSEHGGSRIVKGNGEWARMAQH